MQNFKPYLVEAIDFAPWQHPNSEEYQHLVPNDICSNASDVHRNKNGTYSSSCNRYGAKYIERNGEHVLPVKYSTVKDFEVIGTDTNNISSVWGFPDKVKNNLILYSNFLSSLDHLNTQAHTTTILLPNLKEMGNCVLKSNEISLLDIGEVSFKDFAKCVTVSSRIKISFLALLNKPALSLLKIKGEWNLITPRFMVNEKTMTQAQQDEVKKVIQILNDNRHNIIEAQKKLYDNDLDEYAEL
jgi:hypothetical protein